MAVGNGDMWVVDTGEDLTPGDFLISSSTTGHAMKDTGQFDVAYIVARAAEPVAWDEVTATIDGVKHRKISVFFESFVRNHAQERTEARLRALEAKFDRLTANMERLESQVTMRLEGVSELASMK